MNTKPTFPTCQPDYRFEAWHLTAENAELTRQLDIALHSPGRLAFCHRHAAMAYVRRHLPSLFREAMAHGYEQVTKDGCSYDDYVSRLEARVAEATALMVAVRTALTIAEFPDECALCGCVHRQHAHDCPVPRLVAWQAGETV